MKSELDFINWLNVGLMLSSLLLAYFIPFELFLLAYAVLGPLHYLTEISWLHDRNYFLKSKKEIILFVLIAVILLISAFSAFTGEFTWLAQGIITVAPALVFSGFVFALGALYLPKFWQKVLVFVVAFGAVYFTGLSQDVIFKAWFAVMLPTIIHVFVFTGAFMLFGSIKSRSVSGTVSVLIFLACAGFCFLFVPNVIMTASSFVSANLPIYFGINSTLADMLHFGQVASFLDMFKSPTAIALMRFIAFTYTYHYLNWFSKTSVIKWHKVSKNRVGVILALWIVAVLLYLKDFRLGFIALYLLSMLHVFLEFPLNWMTMIGIGQEVWRKKRGSGGS